VAGSERLAIAMKIYQYADFVVKSDSLSPDDITGALLLEPSSVSWRGARSKEPMMPRTNVWCRRAVGVGCVDDLVRELVELIEPRAAKLGSLTEDGVATATISLMRSFGDDDGVEEDEGDLGLPENLVRLPGQHQLLGFHLDVDLMKRLVALSCSVDFDEYG